MKVLFSHECSFSATFSGLLAGGLLRKISSTVPASTAKRNFYHPIPFAPKCIGDRSLPSSGVGLGAVMPRWQLQLFLFDYALSTHLAVGFRALDYWRYMSASVPPTLPLQPPPWTRRSVAPSPRSR